MINIQAKIHDRFTIEFKVGFNAYREQVISKFSMNTWIFIPYSLDINPSTYSKNMFYRDLRSHTRLITPVYLLSQMVGGKGEPFSLLKSSFERLASDPVKENIGDFEYNIKMFSAIFKSAVRNQLLFIMNPPVKEKREELCTQMLADVSSVLSHYRSLYRIISIPTVSKECFGYYLFGDEFMSNTMHKHLFRLMNFLKTEENGLYKSIRGSILGIIEKELEHRINRGYPIILKDSETSNRDLVYRAGALKKYVESELFLDTEKKRDGAFIEQIYFSVAAGISMIFATAIAFSFQQKFGNFTIPLFVALVVSYMLKDRIKDLTRHYFAHKLKEKYFDNKTTVSINQHKIGWSKEGFDFINDSKVPDNVIKIRERTPLLEADHRYSSEQIILYRKLLELNREQLDLNSEYYISGVNEILRFNLTSYMQKMDDPQVPLYIISDDENYEEVSGSKVYYLNYVIQFKSGTREYYKRYRVVFNRKGIQEIEEML